MKIQISYELKYNLKGLKSSPKALLAKFYLAR
jgi:hypothetical protein